MANRARDKVIYIRVDEALKKRFDRIKEASGYKGNADFLNYLLDVYDGKRVDGVTLKDIRELLAQAVHEMKKQGVNINQIAYTINIYPGVFSDIQFQATNVFLKKNKEEREVHCNGRCIWQCKCELQLLQIGGTAEKCCRLYFRQKKRAGGRWCGKDRTTPV